MDFKDKILYKGMFTGYAFFTKKGMAFLYFKEFKSI